VLEVGAAGCRQRGVERCRPLLVGLGRAFGCERGLPGNRSLGVVAQLEAIRHLLMAASADSTVCTGIPVDTIASTWAAKRFGATSSAPFSLGSTPW
jgi:hypothetical protein